MSRQVHKCRADRHGPATKTLLARHKLEAHHFQIQVDIRTKLSHEIDIDPKLQFAKIVPSHKRTETLLTTSLTV